MKVLNIITGGLNADGITNAWLTFAEELKSNKSYDDVVIDFAKIEGLSNDTVTQRFHQLGISTPKLPARLNAPLKYFRSLTKLLKHGKYDIIHANGSSSLLFIEMFAGLCARTPVRIAHSRNTTCSYKLLHYLLKIPFYLSCNGRLSCGLDAGKWLFGAQKFTILKNGKNFSKFKFDDKIREKKRNELQLSNTLAIGHVGKFNTQKNHKFLIEIFKELHQLNPNTKLFLIGDGELQHDIEELVKKYNLHNCVKFTGAITNIPEFLNAMDIMVFPSLFEGLPNVVLEWQAMGLPCLISDTITRECAPSSLVEFKGLDKSPYEWIISINNLSKYNNRKTQSQEGIKALKDSKFDIKDSTHILIDTYKTLLSKKTNRFR